MIDLLISVIHEMNASIIRQQPKSKKKKCKKIDEVAIIRIFESHHINTDKILTMDPRQKE